MSTKKETVNLDSAQAWLNSRWSKHTADQAHIRYLQAALAALERIAKAGLDDAPEPETYDDIESAYNNGHDVAAFDFATLARIAIRGA